MPVEGTPRFNAVALMEIETIDYRAGQPALVAHAAFINTENGVTYGKTTGRSCWSKETLNILAELRAAMERDIASAVFVDEARTDIRAGALRNDTPAPVGIGEELQPDARSL